MKPLRGSVTDRLSVRADELFDLISDVDRLPEWNEHIHHVVESPARKPQTRDEWVVEIRAMGSRWNSRSRLEEIDRDARRLAVRSQTDDGNPSYAVWSWQVAPVGGSAEVTVSWEIHPKTFWRRVLFAKIRHRQLQQEVHDSLRTAERVITTRSEGATR